MKFFIISPLNHLDLMDLGNAGYFVLAQYYITDRKYREFVKRKRKEGNFVLLDNGVAEGQLVTEDILIDVCKDLQPSEVIAPDILFDKDQTLSNLDSFLKRILDEKISGVQIMAVPQGHTKEDWLECYESILNKNQVCTIGFSKIGISQAFLNMKSHDYIMEARHLCIQELNDLSLLKKPIHCLGAGNPNEFKFYRNFPVIRSNDSNISIWSSINNISFYNDVFKRIPPSNDFFHYKMNSNQLKLAKSNVQYLLENS